ncbi:SusC/RagA family TonB-linked outer membrane protein [Pedobacter metabolipauper]|uniref:TonB-linked SusC/RagA family outer membrane protein n=1 Tax=Pedobacter metabolipauper TaxID=425513 RepID=A0A4R6SRL6_9SPHI|nr:SusC/RagA family TonB-linked outer membrane protein [Pedobacter metabolipauper]TDQ06317.1 TonB-linked SusC/RagA family outer membrane protein [Pedobacter metabolipauper]
MYKNFTNYLGRPPGYILKFLFIMRVAIVIILTTILQLKANVTLAQRININEKNVDLTTILKQIRTQSGYDIIYNKDLVSGIKSLTVNFKNVTVDEALTRSLSNLPLSYVIEDKLIVIKRKAADQIIEMKQADSVLAGKVVDAKTKQGIPGATVSVRNRKGAVITETNGNFLINARVGSVVMVSYIGYKPMQVTVTDLAGRMTVSMEESINEMKDVVVTGMFTRKANTYTGSTTSFKQEDLLKAGSQNVVQSLRNLDPAFAIVENISMGSNPNALPDIQLRGQSGLPDLNGEYSANPNLPLFILDGFETTLQKVIDLDMYRVSSVTLLKDAASKAIYGSKAANGVVVIETLRPQAGQLQVSYNSQIGWEVADLSSYKLTNGMQKLQAELAAGIYQSTNPANQYTLATEYNNYLRAVESGVNTDWLSKPIQNGLNQRHSIRVEGGDQQLVYGVNAMYNGIKGTMKGSDRNILSGAIDLRYRKKAFNINNVLTLQSTKSNNSPWGSFSDYVSMNPYLAYTDASGRIQKIANTVVKPPAGSPNLTSSPVYNPAYNATLSTFDRSNYTDITNNTSIDWLILPSLRAVGRFSFTKQISETDIFLPADHTTFTTTEFTSGAGIFRKGRYTKGNGTNDNLIGNLTLSYTKLINKHAITLNAAYDMSSFESMGNSYIVEGFPNDRLDLPSLGLQYMLNTRPAGTESTVRDMSVLASGNYAYDEKYLLDASYRTTQSSQFGSNNRWGKFWSVGLGWNLHNENIFKELGFVDQFRLRATTGFTGSQGFNSYMSLGTLRYYLDDTYSNENGAYLIGLANPDLKWQRKQDHNFGVDVAVLQRLSANFDYYVSYTDGLLTDITLPPSAGFATYKANLGKVENRGFDFRLRYSVFQNSATRNSLSFFASVSHNKNTLKEISNALQSYNNRQDVISSNPATAGSNLPRVRFVEGQSMDAIYAVPSLGIDPATGREVYQKLDGSVTYDWNAADQVVVGNSLPDFNSNFGFNLQYAGFLVNATFRYTFGGQIYNTTLVNRVENADIYQNVDLRVLSDRWQKPGDISFFKNIADRTNTRLTSRFVEDNNQLTFASLQLQYELDRFTAIKKLGFSRLRAGFQTNEAFVFSTVKVERGTTYPFARLFQFTLNANF